MNMEFCIATFKPGNILLDKKGEPHLTDFGLARLVERESTVTRTTEVLGTPSYMAPEQAVVKQRGNNKRHRHLGLGAVIYQPANRLSAVCWGNNLRNYPAIAGN